MRVVGRWEGKLLDVSGPSALLVLNLKSSRGNLVGDFAVSFLSPEDGGCCGPAQKLSQVGPVSGKADEQSGRVRFNYAVTIGLETVAVTFEGRLMEADPHARGALVGLYSVEKGAGALTLEGGACVLWLYAMPPARRGKNG